MAFLTFLSNVVLSGVVYLAVVENIQDRRAASGPSIWS